MPFPNICVIRTCEWATDRVVLVGRSVGRLVGCTLSFGECSIEYVFEFFFLFFFYFRFPFLRSSRLYSNTYSTFWWKTSVVKCYYWLLLCAHLAHSNSSESYVHICKWLGKKNSPKQKRTQIPFAQTTNTNIYEYNRCRYRYSPSIDKMNGTKFSCVDTEDIRRVFGFYYLLPVLIL